jgi:hypothetical protein
MVPSDKTITEILRILRIYIDEESISLILRDLRKVEGNKSFIHTVRSLYDKRVLTRKRQEKK